VLWLEAINTNLKALGFTRPGLEAITITITPPMKVLLPHA